VRCSSKAVIKYIRRYIREMRDLSVVMVSVSGTDCRIVLAVGLFLIIGLAGNYLPAYFGARDSFRARPPSGIGLSYHTHNNCSFDNSEYYGIWLAFVGPGIHSRLKLFAKHPLCIHCQSGSDSSFGSSNSPRTPDGAVGELLSVAGGIGFSGVADKDASDGHR
jgi:hypothetical protein